MFKAIVDILSFIVNLLRRKRVTEGYEEADKAEKERLEIAEQKTELEMEKEIEEKKKMSEGEFWNRQKW